MQSLTQFFQFMHDIDFPYLVLRNFENLPHSVQSGGHGDLDLLVYDQKHFKELFPKVIQVHKSPRVMHKMLIGDMNVYMDVRYVGDGYYPTHFQLNMLETREYNKKGFFTPNPMHFRLALAYHVVHHKNTNSYKKWLGDVSVKECLESLKKSEIGYCTPNDLTVGRFNQYWKGATSVVSQEGDKVIKKQTSWGTYNLIDNEKRILSKVSSKHFPVVFNLPSNNSEISIEHCGDRLTIENLPFNWKVQLIDIISELEKSTIQHRDVKPDNLMVKDGVIKLIDFGWARFKDDPPDSPPDCLGYPYKPSWGFDDRFSMKKVIKEFEFQLEELCCV